MKELGVTHEAADRKVERIAGMGPPGPLGTEDAEALRAIGIDLEEVRQAIERSFPGRLDRVPATCGIPFTPKAKQAL